MSFIDAIGTLDNPHTRRIATSLINRAIAAQDGYAAQDVLAYSSLHSLLSSTRAQELVNLVEACGLGRGILPEKLLADITIALASAEEVITRAAIPPPQLLVRHPNWPGPEDRTAAQRPTETPSRKLNKA